MYREEGEESGGGVLPREAGGSVAVRHGERCSHTQTQHCWHRETLLLIYTTVALLLTETLLLAYIVTLLLNIMEYSNTTADIQQHYC